MAELLWLIPKRPQALVYVEVTGLDFGIKVCYPCPTLIHLVQSNVY